LLRAWIAFAATFAVLRAVTHGIRAGILPNVNLATEGLHIHHYIWGVGLLLIVGYLLLVDDKAQWHRPLSIAYGVAAALIIDEFALLLNLRDVYFADEGRWSVDIALAVATFLGIYVTAARFWHSAAKELVNVIKRIWRRII